MDVKDLKNKINLSKSFKGITLFLNKRRRWVLSFIFLILIGYCAYLWYSNITNPSWSEARRQEYINTKQNGSIFSKDKFDAVVREVEGKRSEYQRNIENIPDIFRLK